MFCSKCGKEIHDEAVVCVHCGCAVGGNTIQQSQQHSEDYLKFKAFQEDVKNIHILGIVSLVLCLGIGIVFQIINMIKINKYSNRQQKNFVFPEFDFKDSHEKAEYDATIRKFHRAKNMTALGLGISVFLIVFSLSMLPMVMA